MHIALKRISYDLNRFLPKGSDEQVEEIYNLVLNYFKTTKKGKEILDNNGNTTTKVGRPKKEI